MNVRLLLVRPGGTFRRQNGKLTKDFPDHLLNHRDKQAYPLIEGPVFPVTKPYPLNTFEELVAAPPIPPSFMPEKHMAIGEDGGVWLYSPRLIQSPEGLLVRQRKRLDWQEEGRQHAENQSIEQGLGNGLLTFGGIAAVVVFCIMAMLTALVLAQYRFGPKETEAPTVLALALLGAVMSSRFYRGRPSTKSGSARSGGSDSVESRPHCAASDQQLARRISVYMYDSLDQGKKHYSLPFREVADHIGLDSLTFPDISRYRLLAGTLLPALLGLLVFAVLWYAPASPVIVLIILVEMVVLPGAALLGWWQGPVLIQIVSPSMRPFCVVRRGIVSQPADREAGDDEEEIASEICVMPLRHTHGTGVDSAIYDDIINEILEEARQQAEEQDLEVLPEYRPIVNRARDVYEDLMARLEREDTRIENTLQEKLQIGSLVVMAFASIGVLFFTAFATTS